MDLSTRVIGSTVAKHLQGRVTAPVLTIGRDTFTRGALAAVTCFNFTAAQNLSTLLRTLDVRDTRDLFDRIAPSALALPGLGAVSLATLGAAFEAKGIGGDRPLLAWVLRHQPKEQRSEADVVLFTTMKKRIAADSEEQRRTMRKTARRDQAHRLRVSRFETRQRKRA